MTGQDAVIRLLSDPATYGVDRVERTETHASLVFLAGDRVFKLKRAVHYSYLDYSTPDRRQAACEAELAINRRFAPSLYRSVETVTRADDGRLQLGGEGRPVDWVVVMQRFDADAQLDHVAERGALTATLVTRLADRIAALHGDAERCPDAGGAAGLRRAIDITVDNLRPAAGAVFAATKVEAWTQRARAALDAHATLLDRRRAAGKIRACHGDLHLRNICLIDGDPVPFDAIEFDPGLSSTDVLYDLAFLLMDLLARGLAGSASLLLNRYLDITGEDDGLAALPLFLSVRAAIRAQVAAAAAETADSTLAAEAVRYLDLACALLDDRPPPRLIAIGGLSGSGKSTLAYGLAPLTGQPPGARVLRSDVLRKRAAGVPLEAALPPDAYTAEAREATYRALCAQARQCIESGCTVIADAVWTSPEHRAMVRAIAEQAGIAFDGLWLVAPLPDMLRRVAGRTADPSDATPEIIREQASRPTPAPEDWKVIPAGANAGAVLKAARRATR